MSQAILFDRDQVERLNGVAEWPKRLRGSELLWIDVDRSSDEDVDRVAEAFGLDREPASASRPRRIERYSGTTAAISTSRRMRRTKTTKGD